MLHLDSGRLVIWDLTAIALNDANPNRLKLYRKVVFASASIPIMVPPVAIDGNLYEMDCVRETIGLGKLRLCFIPADGKH